MTFEEWLEAACKKADELQVKSSEQALVLKGEKQAFTSVLEMYRSLLDETDTSDEPESPQGNEEQPAE